MFVALKGGGLAAKYLPSAGATAKELCKILPQKNINKIQVAGLTRAKYRDENEVPNIKPFPYHKKEYGMMQMLFFDLFSGNRVSKHTKLITIDGPVAAGKDKLAKELAKELDFLYIPQPTFDDLLISPWGFDARTLDAQLPKGAQTWDIERFCQDPFDIHSAMMQLHMYMMRQKSYMECLCHIFCTGQGVVTVRSPWSDTVFTKAMFRSNYISREALRAIQDSHTMSLYNYLKPHLVIYLDVPVDKTMENIKKKGESFERNGKAFTEQYLSDIEMNYKRDFLPYMKDFSLMLCYDWAEGGDLELMMEDIEDLDFEKYTNHETLLADWRLEKGVYRYYARLYSAEANVLLRNMEHFRLDCPEINISGEDRLAWHQVYSKIPDYQYAQGYNTLKGDTDLLTKTQHYFCEDRVTPLLEKYYERKKREEGSK